MEIDLLSPNLYFNREFSWLKFNSRVLEQSNNLHLPALERLKFIAIYGTNLDEFYMIRIAGLKSIFKARIQEIGVDKSTPFEQLKNIHTTIHKEQKLLEKYFQSILKELKQNNLNIINYNELSTKYKNIIKEQFINQIYPILTPIAIDSTHPFPHLNNLSFGLALKLSNSQGDIKFALIRIPKIIPNFLHIDGYYIPIETIINDFSSKLFKGFNKISSTYFRVTRNADLEIEEEEADDFVEILEEGLRARERGELIRLEIMENTDKDLLQLLTSHLEFDKHDIYRYNIPLNLGRFWNIVEDKNFAHLVLPTYSPKIFHPFLDNNIFDSIEKQDSILYHPYESFEPIIKFIQEASEDKNTLAIRMTLYRIGKNSPIIRALINAAERGKQITIIFELKARFDEENNLHWAKKLENAGAHVIYGLKGLKVHAKIVQVIKSKGDKLQSYLHIGTGNYNTVTSRIYTDISFFTSKKNFNKDATKFFNFLTGFSEHPNLETLFIAPRTLKSKLLNMIKKESFFKEKGFILLKANSLVDTDIIQALYKASQLGCKIKLFIRGICTLKPKIKEVSENISVYSIIGKYLEHSRIYYFANNKDKYYISSSDLMPRNLTKRVEIMISIQDKNLAQKIKYILFLQLIDNELKWELDKDGNYIKDKDKNINSQNILEEYIYKLNYLK